jgi:hypothetical protein
MLFAQNKVTSKSLRSSAIFSPTKVMPPTSVNNILEPTLNESKENNSNNSEMVQLFHQLENQQLANYILKNKIESLKASTKNSSSSSSLSPRSMPTTPTSLLLKSNRLAAAAALSSSQDDLALNFMKSNAFISSSSSSSHQKSLKLEEDLLHDQQIKSKSQTLTKLKKVNKIPSNDSSCPHTSQPSGLTTTISKTPKSALLERRRKAVFELLTRDSLYPSDDQMNEFLRQNKEIFSNRSEFLTKLREVRQKIMNNRTSNNNIGD